MGGVAATGLITQRHDSTTTRFEVQDDDGFDEDAVWEGEAIDGETPLKSPTIRRDASGSGFTTAF